jgi:hypothetical protein
MATGSAESKAEKKADVKTQALSVAISAASPVTAWRREGHDFVGIETDATLTGASVTFKVGDSPTVLPTKVIKKDDGTPYIITIGVSDAARIDPSYFSGWQFILPVLNTVQVGNATVVTGKFRSFRSGT